MLGQFAGLMMKALHVPHLHHVHNYLVDCVQGMFSALCTEAGRLPGDDGTYTGPARISSLPILELSWAHLLTWKTWQLRGTVLTRSDAPIQELVRRFV